MQLPCFLTQQGDMIVIHHGEYPAFLPSLFQLHSWIFLPVAASAEPPSGHCDLLPFVHHTLGYILSDHIRHGYVPSCHQVGAYVFSVSELLLILDVKAVVAVRILCDPVFLVLIDIRSG